MRTGLLQITAQIDRVAVWKIGAYDTACSRTATWGAISSADPAVPAKPWAGTSTVNLSKKHPPNSAGVFCLGVRRALDGLSGIVYYIYTH